MPDTLYLKKDDIQPYYYFQILDALNAAVNLTGATIYCTMKNTVTGTLKINRQTTGITIDSATNGTAHYVWQSGDTDTPGGYYIEFEINPLAGGKFTVPVQDSDACVVVRDSLDGT